MTWSEGEDGMQGEDTTTASGKVEKVRVAILRETTVGGLGKLLGKDGEVSVEP